MRQLSVDSRWPLSTARITLRPSRKPGEDHEHGGLVLLQPRLDVDAVDPQEHRLEVGERPRPPELVLGLPPRLQPGHRGRRQRGAVAEQPAQREIEVAQREPVQVQPREQLPHGLRPALEQGQQLALEPLGQPADARPPQGDRADAQAQPARLPVAVAIAGRRIEPSRRA